MATHGFGFVGCGMIAEFHTKAIAEIPGRGWWPPSTCIAPSAEKIAKMAGNDCRVYDDIDAMLANPEVDVVSRVHAQRCPHGARRSRGPGRQACRGREADGDHPASMRRHHPGLRRSRRTALHDLSLAVLGGEPALKKAIDDGRFGRLTLGDTYVKWWRTQAYYDSGGWRGTWKLDGGGALMNQAIHNVDLLQWLMGDVDTIMAQTALLVHERIEVEDTAVAVLRFKNGALGVIEAATSTFPGLLKRVEIHGEHGSARIEQDDITFWSFATEAPGDAAIHEAMKATTGHSAGASDPRGITHEGHRVQLADFLQAIDTGGQPFVDGPQGRKAVEVIRAFYHSAKTGQSVRLPYADPGL